METWPVHVAHTGARGVLGVAPDGRISFSGVSLAPQGHTLVDVLDGGCSIMGGSVPEEGQTDTLVLLFAARPSSWTCDVCGAEASGARCAECGSAPDLSTPSVSNRNAGIGSDAEHPGSAPSQSGRCDRAPWTCSVCTLTGNSGDVCEACGSPMPKQVLPGPAPPQPAPKASSCAICGEVGSGTKCTECGAPMKPALVSNNPPAGRSALPSPVAATWQCATCTLENGIAAPRCGACGAPAVFVGEGDGRVRSALVFASSSAAKYARDRLSALLGRRSANLPRGLGGILERTRRDAAAATADISAAFSDLDALCIRADAMLRVAREMLGRAESSAETDLARMLVEIDASAGSLSPGVLSSFLERLFTYRAGRGELGAASIPDLYVIYCRAAGGNPPRPADFAAAVSGLDPRVWKRLALGSGFEVVVWADVDVAAMLDIGPNKGVDVARVAKAAKCPMALASALLLHEEDRGALVRDVSPVTGVVSYYPNLILPS